MPLMAGDFDTLTVGSTTPVGLTPSKVVRSYEDGSFFAGKKCEKIQFSVEGQVIRYQTHLGAAPTSSTGHLESPATVCTVRRVRGHYSIKNFQMIAVTGQATVQVTYWYLV